MTTPFDWKADPRPSILANDRSVRQQRALVGKLRKPSKTPFKNVLDNNEINDAAKKSSRGD